jgi:hypothetical protein
MAVDPSISLDAQTPAAPNPLAQIGQYAMAGNALVNMRQGQQNLAARNALSDAISTTPIDPTTGLPQQNALLAKVLSGPAAWIAPQIIQQQQEQTQRGLAINQAQLQQTQARTGIVNSALAPLMAKGANVTPADIYTTVAGLHNAGFPVGESLNDMATTMPQPDPSQANNPKYMQAYGQQLQGWVTNRFGRTLDPSGQLRAFQPNVTTVNTGGSTQLIDANPITNPGAVGSSLQNTLSPAQAVQQVPGPVGKNGQPTVIPQASYATGAGYGGLVAGTPGAPGAPAGTSPFGTGRLPPALRNPANAQSNAAGAPVPPGGAPMTVGMGPGQSTAMAATGTEAGDEAANLMHSAQDIPTRQAMLTGMLGDLNNASTGPLTATWESMMSRLVQAGATGPLSPNTQASRENFAKMASQFAQMQSQRLGAVTNDKLSTSLASNPNQAFTTLGNQGVIHVLQGNEDALAVKNSAWQQAQAQGATPDQFPAWSAQFNQQFDPRVFWVARMAPQERKTLLSRMTLTDRAKFQGSVGTALDNGWVSPADLGITPSTPAAGQ